MYFSRIVPHCCSEKKLDAKPRVDKMKKITGHIAFESLADIAEGRPVSGELAEMQTHISRCQRCGAEYARLASVMRLMRDDTNEDAPPEVVAEAVKLFRAHTTSFEPSRLRRLVAVLKFDSAQMSPAHGVRSGQTDMQRQILFSTHEYDLDLRIASGDGNWLISGQVFGPECAGGQIELEGDSGMTRAKLNDQCEFDLSPVPTGSYTVRLLLTNTVVEIPELELRPDGA